MHLSSKQCYPRGTFETTARSTATHSQTCNWKIILGKEVVGLISSHLSHSSAHPWEVGPTQPGQAGNVRTAARRHSHASQPLLAHTRYFLLLELGFGENEYFKQVTCCLPKVALESQSRGSVNSDVEDKIGLLLTVLEHLASEVVSKTDIMRILSNRPDRVSIWVLLGKGTQSILRLCPLCQTTGNSQERKS